jgi:hypothetical protein
MSIVLRTWYGGIEERDDIMPVVVERIVFKLIFNRKIGLDLHSLTCIVLTGVMDCFYSFSVTEFTYLYP